MGTGCRRTWWLHDCSTMPPPYLSPSHGSTCKHQQEEPAGSGTPGNDNRALSAVEPTCNDMPLMHQRSVWATHLAEEQQNVAAPVCRRCCSTSRQHAACIIHRAPLSSQRPARCLYAHGCTKPPVPPTQTDSPGQPVRMYMACQRNKGGQHAGRIQSCERSKGPSNHSAVTPTGATAASTLPLNQQMQASTTPEEHPQHLWST
jgi:hypothetical protein